MRLLESGINNVLLAYALYIGTSEQTSTIILSILNAASIFGKSQTYLIHIHFVSLTNLVFQASLLSDMYVTATDIPHPSLSLLG
jgi:hypothetical protein